MSRSLAKRWLAAPLVCALAGIAAWAQVPPSASPASRPHSAYYQKDEVDRALDRAVSYLVRQQAEDGSISKESQRRRRGDGIAQNSTALTSLAVMAIASLGHSPTDETPEGRALRNAMECVLDGRRQRQDGYFGSADGSRMYGHGIAALMLGEMLGMGINREQDQQIRSRLASAIELILRSQRVGKESRFRGGWRYEPESNDADLSVTVWQVMALRSARNAGLAVPKEAIDQAADYIRRSYSARGRREGIGEVQAAGFAYQPGGQGTYAMASAGLLSLQVCGLYDDPIVMGASDWLLGAQPSWETQWFFYGTYYYAQGMHQRGGRHADDGRRVVQSILLAHQEQQGPNAGSWNPHSDQERDAGRPYATAMAILSLSVKYHYLPIYQR